MTAQNQRNLPQNQILQGDCVDILQTLPDRSVDLIFADPPYNLQLQRELLRPNQTVVDGVDDEWDKFDELADYDAFSRVWLRECRRVLKDEGTIWVIGSYHNIFRIGAIMMDIGYWILNDVIWHKTNPMPNFRGTRFTNATETLVWAQKVAGSRYTFNYQAMKALNEDKQMQNVWYIPLCTGEERLKVNGKKAHSTQKPEALLYRVLLAASNPGDLVLDPFFGSGTTGAVAKKMKRHYIGIERDAFYAELAQQRLADIPEPEYADDILMTATRRNQPRVKFGQLIEAGYIQPGQALFSRKRDFKSVIKADSHLDTGEFVGSIHKTAAHVQNKPTFNGWEFWYYEDDDGNLHSIDELRERYRREVG